MRPSSCLTLTFWPCLEKERRREKGGRKVLLVDNCGVRRSQVSLCASSISCFCSLLLLLLSRFSLAFACLSPPPPLPLCVRRLFMLHALSRETTLGECLRVEKQEEMSRGGKMSLRIGEHCTLRQFALLSCVHETPTLFSETCKTGG